MDPMEAGRHQDLEMLCEEVLSDPDEWLHSERFIALVGRAEVEQLVREAQDCLAITGGYQLGTRPIPALGGTPLLLMKRLEQDPERAKRLAEAFNTLETEAAGSDPDGPDSDDEDETDEGEANDDHLDGDPLYARVTVIRDRATGEIIHTDVKRIDDPDDEETRS